MRALETTNMRLNAELGMYKDRHSNIEVLREEKHALERKVEVMEELRERVVSLEAQVEVARQERQEWLVSHFFKDRFLIFMYHRANKSNEISTLSKPSLSVVQKLSELRLTHARLFEEHGATLAILRSREAELAKTQESLAEAQSTITALHAEVRGLKDKVTRRDQRTQLAERELGFLQALVVRMRLVCQPCVSPSVQASYTAEGVRDTPAPDSSLVQRVQQLEQSLHEYKTLNNQLQVDLDAVDAEENLVGVRQTRKELRTELELQKANVAKAGKGITHEESCLLFELTYWCFQSSKMRARLLRHMKTRLRSLNRLYGS